MADPFELARMSIHPSGYGDPLPLQTLKLIKQGDDYRVETTEQIGRKRKHWRAVVTPEDATRQMGLLRKASLPAFPISPLVCDGEYIELTIHGNFSDLTLGWWSAAPEGTDALADFSEWLRKLGLPDEDECDDD